jgi:hypothetical protein
MILERLAQLERYDLRWWTSALVPILREFVAAAEGQFNIPFWRSLYKLDEKSGGPYITGWITAFFPYLRDWKSGQSTRVNPWLEKGGDDLQELLYPLSNIDPCKHGHGPRYGEFPGGLARAPFRWNYLKHTYEMELLGGFVGVRQNGETLSLRPEIGWAVREQEAA